MHGVRANNFLSLTISVLKVLFAGPGAAVVPDR